jgi:ABC-type multidrug transport system permease subunit
MLPFFLVAAIKDFGRRLSDPMALVTWLGIPFVIGGLLSLVMGGGSGEGVPRAKLLFVDQDESFISKSLAGMVSGSGADSMIELVPLEFAEARERIDAGDGSAMLVIPDGFGQALLESQPTELRLITNPSQTILPKILQEGLEMLVEATFYGQELFGDQLRILANGPPDDSNFFANAVLLSQAGAINSKLQDVEGTLFPPLIELLIDVVEKEEKEPSSSPLSLLFPGMLFMSMLFIAQGMSGDIWEEHNSGALRRMLSTPQGMASFLLGKVLAAAMIVAGVTALGLLAGVLWFDFPLSGCLPALLWGTLSGASLVPIFMFAQTLGSNQQAGSVMTSMLLFPMMMLGGSLFPIEAMPAWMVEIGQWTPNGMGLIEFKRLLFDTAQSATLLRSLLCLTGLSILFFMLGTHRTVHKMAKA